MINKTHKTSNAIKSKDKQIFSNLKVIKNDAFKRKIINNIFKDKQIKQALKKLPKD